MTKKETRKKMHKHSKHEKEKKELENLNNKIKELTDSLQRLQAEFENYKKRVEKEKQDSIKYASQGLIV
ncbi:nucleotide exchange factor GrpE, partial [Candidatus Woesearchaeota archaeon]|nr:nucleotide exchange factor GrpE [Candidatus Woesearchaeota archaeon]